MTPKFTRGGARPPAKEATLLQVRPYELHGTQYFAVLLQMDAEPDRAREARLSFDMIYDEPRPGDRVRVESVLGVVDRVTRSEQSQANSKT